MNKPGYSWLATLQRSLGGNALDGNLNTMNAPWWRTNKYHQQTDSILGLPTPPHYSNITVIAESILELWNFDLINFGELTRKDTRNWQRLWQKLFGIVRSWV
jgi:hypothetical protein